MKATVISILILSFSSNVAGGLPPAQRPGLRPLAQKEVPPLPGNCLIVIVPAKAGDRPRKVCKIVEGSKYQAGFHIPSKVSEYACDAKTPCTQSGNDCFVRLTYVPEEGVSQIVGVTCH
ncbi:hypothetical protein RU639_006330 [Aspergillus parasiticus]